MLVHQLGLANPKRPSRARGTSADGRRRRRAPEAVLPGLRPRRGDRLVRHPGDPRGPRLDLPGRPRGQGEPARRPRPTSSRSGTSSPSTSSSSSCPRIVGILPPIVGIGALVLLPFLDRNPEVRARQAAARAPRRDRSSAVGHRRPDGLGASTARSDRTDDEPLLAAPSHRQRVTRSGSRSARAAVALSVAPARRAGGRTRSGPSPSPPQPLRRAHAVARASPVAPDVPARRRVAGGLPSTAGRPAVADRPPDATARTAATTATARSTTPAARHRRRTGRPASTARAGIGCADCHGGDPTSDQITVAMDPANGFIGKPTGARRSASAAAATRTSSRMRQYELPTDQYAKY